MRDSSLRVTRRGDPVTSNTYVDGGQVPTRVEPGDVPTRSLLPCPLPPRTPSGRKPQHIGPRTRPTLSDLEPKSKVAQEVGLGDSSSRRPWRHSELASRPVQTAALGI